MISHCRNTVLSIWLLSTCLVCSVLTLFLPATLQAQPFTTVLNIPPDPDIGDNQSIGSDTQLNLADGGAIGTSFDAGSFLGTSTNIEVNIDGGTVGDLFAAYSGSTVHIEGGVVGAGFRAMGASVAVSGGSVGEGGEFHVLNGSTLEVTGGTFDGTLSALGSNVAISSGDFRADDISLTSGSFTNSNTNIHGGVFEGSLNFDGGVTNIFGGEFAGPSPTSVFMSSGELNIYGGSIPNGIFVSSFEEIAELNIHGGSIGLVTVLVGGSVNLFGTQFLVDSVDITDSLIPNTQFAITEREGTLNALLADGSPLDINLSSVGIFPALSSTVTITLVPEPNGMVIVLGCLISLTCRGRHGSSNGR